MSAPLKIPERTLVSSITNILEFLRQETRVWIYSEKSKTYDLIVKYEDIFGILLIYVEKKEIKSFVEWFKKNNVTLDGLLSCFRKHKDNEVEEKRMKVSNDFRFVCERMLAIIERGDVRKVVFDDDLSYEETKKMFGKG